MQIFEIRPAVFAIFAMPLDRPTGVGFDVPSRPFPVVGDEQMVEKVQLFYWRHPDVRMAPQLNPEPRCGCFLNPNAKKLRKVAHFVN